MTLILSWRTRIGNIYIQTDRYISSSTEGWDLESNGSHDELEAPTESQVSQKMGKRRKTLGPSFFTLSGGIMKRDPRTANRIDSLLSKMMAQPSNIRYSPHVDKNLDYLYTSLELDMINMVAEEFRAKEEEEPEEKDELPLEDAATDQ